MITAKEIRDLFPALNQTMNGRPLVYLDNAATSQKPQPVLDLINRMNGGVNANVHRAMYDLSDRATQLYEGARERVRRFLNAPGRENVIFTSGTTASVNLAAACFCGKYLGPGDAVLVTADSHHSNIVPWQLACERQGAHLRVLPLLESGEWDLERLPELLDGRVKIVAATQISNVLGIVNPLQELIAAAHAEGIPVLVDGAQGIVHLPVDVQRLDCDFYAFSGHKIYGATGTGILYGKTKWLEEMPPYMGGGDMVGTVTFEKTTYAPLPLKYEAGTPNFIGAASLDPALAFVQQLREGEAGAAAAGREKEITGYMREALREIAGCRLYGDAQEKIPLFSFNVEGCHAGDIAQLLDKMGVAVRSGMMCAEPVMARFGVTSMVRASFAPYNTLEEAQCLIAGLRKAVKMLR